MPRESSSSSSRPQRPTSSRSNTGRPSTSSGGRPPAKKSSASVAGRKPAAPRNANPHAARGKAEKAASRDGKPASPSGRPSGRNASAGKPLRAGAQRTERTERSPEAPARKGWGSVARKGAAKVRNPEMRESTRELERIERAPDRRKPDFEVARVDAPKVKRATGKPAKGPSFTLPEEAIKELRERVSEKRAEKLAKHLKDAARAYAGERWGDVRKAIRPLLNDVPDAPSVQELNGMLLYRTGKWAAAAKELQAVQDVTNSYDLVPAIMDCHRALKKEAKVKELWDDLRIASPGADVMAEGRIVMAETLADKGDLRAAIDLLEKAPRARQKVQLHHLRSMYALADLYDRAGEVGKARQFFQRVADNDPELADVLARLEALGS